MSKYSRFYSNYVRRKIHKRLKDSVIYERDWVTTGGGVQRLSKGQRAIYGDGNFIFTTSNIPNPKRRHIGSSTSETFSYGDVKNVKETADINSRPFISKDMRDYAYYGSCVEMIRASIEGIILEFPGRLVVTNELVDTDEESTTSNPMAELAGFNGIKIYRVSNPFQIDMHHSRPDEIEITPRTNELRYLCLSADKYECGYNDSLEEVTDFNVVYDNVDCVPNNGTWYKIGSVTINGKYLFYICRKGKDITYFSTLNGFKLQPKIDVIEEYFSKIDGFEAVLLNRESDPLYTNTFITPIMGNLNYKYVDRVYRWPSKDGFISIDSPQFFAFYSSLIDIGNAFDTEWSDNLYSRMTHEAIKRYDTTFDRTYIEGDEEDMVDGGQRMEKILRLMGSVFDDVKKSADGIKRTIDLKYGSSGDGMDIDTVDDKLELSGWEVYSTICETLDKEGNWKTDVTERLGDNSIKDWKWYPTLQKGKMTYTDVDDEFRRRLLLSARHINSAKGTIHGIEMILGLFGLQLQDDYTIEEKYYKLPKDSVLDYDTAVSNMNELAPYCDFNDDGDSEFPGVPLKAVTIGGNDVVIPFYEKDKLYADPNFYFQSRGGWGKNSKLDDSENYDETLNYLKVVSTFGDLLRLNAMDLEKDMLYYVVNLSTYIEDANIDSDSATDEMLSKLTHYFKCDNQYNPSQPSSWPNVQEGDKLYSKCEYLDSLVNTALGNNPHVGYDRYDDGEEFFETMGNPFKYALKYKIDDEDLKEKAKPFILDEDNGFEDVPVNTELIRQGNDDDANIDEEHIFYNDKSLLITFKASYNDETFKENFKHFITSVIIPYLSQVIPSTTIVSYQFKVEETNNGSENGDVYFKNGKVINFIGKE